MKRIFSLLSLLVLAAMACSFATAPLTEAPPTVAAEPSAGNQPAEAGTSLP